MVTTATITSSVNAIEPNKSTSDIKSYGYYKINDINEPLSKNIKTNSDLIVDLNTSTSDILPDNREAIIIYFKEMPASMGEFASSYGITPTFVKDDIKMAAFETSSKKEPGVTSEKTLNVIEKLKKDKRVDSVKEDLFQFVDKKKGVNIAPEVLYPKDVYSDYKGSVNKVVVGFWRYPASLEEFGVKYDGKLVEPTEADLTLQKAVFLTDDVEGFIKKVSKDPYVSYVFPDMPSGRVSSYTPNDEYWIYQGGVVNINCPQAWDYQKGSDSIIVAVIDSGVWASHPDLSGRIINGRDFINNTANSNDDYGHGTIMAGIIAATMDNSIGIAGVAHSRILALKAVDSQGYVYGNAVADALNYAANNGAKIISMSFGCTNIPALSQAINYAYSQGCLLVAATGNAGSAVIDYPAAYDQVIAVGALGVNNARWSLSNYGPQIDLVAYGEGILSTHIGPTHDTQYGVSSGTSDACAFVAGVAALVWSQNPTTLRDRIVTYLINSADDFGNPGFDNEYGNGRVNAYGAVTYGQMLVTGSDSLSGPGDSKGLMFDVPSPAIIHTILAGNENADFDIFLKWNSPASSTNYDVKSDSGYCFEHALTKGAGTLYVAIYSYSGSGNFKLWSLSGSPTDGSIIIGNVQQGQGSYSYGNGWGKGYAFTSGPDGCNFDLTIKWNALGMPWDCDAIGNTPAAQEYAGPVYGTGQLYGMTYSVSGNGDFVMMRAIY